MSARADKIRRKPACRRGTQAAKTASPMPRSHETKFIPENRLESEDLTLADYDKVIIKNRGRVVAVAKWRTKDNSHQLEVVRVKRPQLTTLQPGAILSSFEISPERDTDFSERPELLTSGWQLIRNKNYDSSEARQRDPHWKTHTGWFLIPETINGQDGLAVFLETHPEIRDGGYEVKRSDEVDPTKLRIAPAEETDCYVSGLTKTVPELQSFREPETADMVKWRRQRCQCGCDKYEGWYLYYVNRFIAYEPREKDKRNPTDKIY